MSSPSIFARWLQRGSELVARAEHAAIAALPKKAVPEALTVWAVCFAATAIAFPFSKPIAKLVATVGFLFLPQLAMATRGEDYRDYGLSLRTWRADVRLFAIVGAIVFPLFIGGYVAFTALFPLVPLELIHRFTPYVTAPHFAFALPNRFSELVIDHVFVVALPEEFFYRGYLMTRLRDGWPQGRMFLGVRLGPAFWMTAVLFALGHLAIFEVWRLAVFFPALIFAWMRERTGSVIGAAMFHASSNLLIQVLDASFFGP